MSERKVEVPPGISIDPVTVQITPSLEFLNDILITACEGGIGYWALCKRYKWRETNKEFEDRNGYPTLNPDQLCQLPFADVVLVPQEDGTEFPETQVTPEHIRKGLQLALTPDVIFPGTNTAMSAFRGLTTMDACEIDAEAADNILQLGMFGKLVYA